MKYTLRNVAGMLAALALLTGCITPPSPDAGKSGNIEVWWLGQSATRITTVSGKVIMIDPWITTNPKTPAQYKNLDALGKIDLILVSHAHGDHIGVNGREYDAVTLSKKHNAPLWGPAGLNQSLITLGILSSDLSLRFGKGGTITPAVLGMKVTTSYREVLPNVALFDVIRSVQPLPRSNPGAHQTEFRETQQLLSFRFLFGGPPGTDPSLLWKKPVVQFDAPASPAPKRPVVGPER